MPPDAVGITMDYQALSEERKHKFASDNQLNKALESTKSKNI